jgi:hypothetical protein
MTTPFRIVALNPNAIDRELLVFGHPRGGRRSRSTGRALGSTGSATRRGRGYRRKPRTAATFWEQAKTSGSFSATGTPKFFGPFGEVVRSACTPPCHTSQ